ncbi:MAG: hypothetical protein MJ174_06050 [Treponema sp.]|nr:hypothetical protein [Treponema sp.]
MQRCVVAYSSQEQPENAFDEVVKKLKSNESEPILIIFFSTEKDFWYYSKNIKQTFPNATTIGSTTYRNLTSKGHGTEGFSAMAIYSGIEVTSGVLFYIDVYPANYVNHVKQAVKGIENEENCCCVCFSTAVYGKEGLVLDTLKKGFNGKKIPIIGGSSGMSNLDNYGIVSLNGDIYKKTAVFAIIKNLNGKIIFTRENIFKRTNHTFKTTDVDCEECRVYELDDKPAANAISEATGIPVSNLTEYFTTHTMGRIINDDPFITEVNKIYEDGSISYFATIYNRSNVALLELDDIENVWKKTNAALKEKLENPSFGLVVNCYARTRLFEKMQLLDKFIDILKSDCGNFIGVTGFGEQLRSDHMNQTMVLALFE